jgi:hypothetical protein
MKRVATNRAGRGGRGELITARTRVVAVRCVRCG